HEPVSPALRSRRPSLTATMTATTSTPTMTTLHSMRRFSLPGISASAGKRRSPVRVGRRLERLEHARPGIEAHALPEREREHQHGAVQVRPDRRARQVPADRLEAAAVQNPFRPPLPDRHPAVAPPELARAGQIEPLAPVEELVRPLGGRLEAERLLAEPGGPE